MKVNSMWLAMLAVTMFHDVSLGMAMSESATKYVEVSFKIASPITLHEPVVIQSLLENKEPYGITCDLGFQGTSAFQFIVIAPNGMQVEPFPRIENGGGFAPVYLEPEDKYHQRILLNRWYAFDIPGKYRIIVTLELPIIKGKTELPWIMKQDESGHQTEEVALDLTILPRNEAALKKRCDDLFHKLKETYYFSERTPIAEELSYIKDPIAIPYLAKLVKEKEEGAAIQGLMRIGTDEALEAMILVTQSKYNEAAAAHAKALLREKVTEIRDPTIQKKVMDAIR
jgi:hypothetical protein